MAFHLETYSHTVFQADLEFTRQFSYPQVVATFLPQSGKCGLYVCGTMPANLFSSWIFRNNQANINDVHFFWP